MAVIEGEALREGQGANGIRVRKIHQDRVEVLDRGNPRVLYLDKLRKCGEPNDRYAGNMNSFKKLALIVAAGMALTACSNNPLMRRGAATSTDAADDIVRTLEQARPSSRTEVTPRAATSAMPADISAQLLRLLLRTTTGRTF
ncbi:hypothetical protein ACFPTY_19895 [Halomonas beimenensis]|uniref:hypothetical protein n=1 Tax=Halomonas beimenensis TaxID=475662 RepID=UPI00362314FB